MGFTGFHASGMSGWAENQTASGTADIECSPSSVYATAMITGIGVANNGLLWSGILEYRTKDPNTGKHTTNTVGNLTWSFSLADWVDDSNVDRVTFAMGIWDSGGGYVSSSLEAAHQIWFFD